MTETAQAMIPLTEIPVSVREQAKADILESYLFSSLSHSPETLTATITTTMKQGDEKLNALALIQILQRFHLETVKASGLIIYGVLAEEDFHKSIFVPWDDEGLGRTVTMVSHGNDVTLTVSGTLPKDGKDGEIIRTFFEKGTEAGKILSDGRIDFRELHRYSSVKAGEPLLQVSLPHTEKNGLSHEGTPIQATLAKEYAIQLGQNVEKVYVTTEGAPPSYEVRALKEGVVNSRIGQGGTDSIDISDRIIMGDVDFSVGNIGSDVPCPVSLQAQTVNEGFTVNVAGSVTIKAISGGDVTSIKKAEVDEMRPGSRLTSCGDITCRSVASSIVKSETGTISIKREAIDSTLNAHRVIMNASTSLLLNTRINTCVINLDNVRVSGTNYVVLGSGLFTKRDDLIKEKQRVNAALHEADENLNTTKALLVGELKSLSAEFGADTSVRPVFKEIVEALKAYDFEKLPALMSSLKRGNTCMAVGGILRTIELVKPQLHRFWELEARAQGLVAEVDELEERLSSIAFSINARIRPSAALEIHLGNKDTAPLILASPPGNDQDHAVSIKGQFTLESGLKTSKRSG
jgi:hypothetical protein